MKPGRELDALVAEKVMGRIVVTWNGQKKIQQYAYAAPYDIPEYSTSIADAWRVVEHMAKPDTRWDFELFSANPNVGPAEYFATHVTYTADEPRQEGRSDTSMPHAICLAALKAVGHEPEAA